MSLALALNLLGQAEVGDSRVSVPVEQDIGRLEVAVNDPALVGVADGIGDACNQLGRLAGRQWPAGERLGKALALNEAHGEVVLASVLADFVDRHDPGMVQVGGRLRFNLEAAYILGVGKLAGEDHFQGDDAVEADLPGLKYDPHSTAGDLADDLVIPKITHAQRAGGRSLGFVGLVEGCGREQFVRRRRQLNRRPAVGGHARLLLDGGRRQTFDCDCGGRLRIPGAGSRGQRGRIQ